MAGRRNLTFWLAGAALLAGGCRLGDGGKFAPECGDECLNAVATQIEYPEVSACTASCESWAPVEPPTLSNPAQPTYWDLSLQEVVQLALSHSEVIRDLGGAVVRAPAQVETHWDPAITETDPRFGVDAALSAYDANFTASAYGAKNDRALNNQFLGGGTRVLSQDTAVVQAQIAKRSAVGAEMAFRHYIDYDANNAPANLFPSAWNTNFEAQVRQPLLQGAGTQFSRIAGTTGIAGLYNGVLIARVNADIELTEFEGAVRDLVSNLENAYWDLYFAYRDLDAKIAARDAALETWRSVSANFKAGRKGGEAEKEAQAREQYFRFQEEVQNALSGRLIDGTRTDNGSSGGTFRAAGGVHVAERRLRHLIGLPPADGRLLRPADEPMTAPVSFAWSEISCESLVRRVELRRQRWLARRYELELTASKNFLLPKLDAVGLYRWRGFGDDLLDPNSDGLPEFDNAYANLTSGNYQEWQMGLELNVPLGYRKGFAAVRNAQLQLARARAVLKEQEHLVLHDVAGAVAELDRAMVVAQTTASRLEASQTQLKAVEAAFASDKAPLDLLLEAQRSVADAESRHYRSLAEHAVAVKNVHYSKGTLLDYDGVYLSEAGWPAKAYRDAAERERLRGAPIELNYASAMAPRVSRGPYDQLPALATGSTSPAAAAAAVDSLLPATPLPGAADPTPASSDGQAPPPPEMIDGAEPAATTPSAGAGALSQPGTGANPPREPLAGLMQPIGVTPWRKPSPRDTAVSTPSVVPAAVAGPLPPTDQPLDMAAELEAAARR